MDKERPLLVLPCSFILHRLRGPKMYRHVLWLTVFAILTPLGHGWQTLQAGQECPSPGTYIPPVCYPVHPTCAEVAPVIWPPSMAANAAAASPGTYAQPTAAPPSEGPISTERPGASAAKKPGGPTVSENLGYYDSYALAPDKRGTASSDRGTLVLWNLTDHEVTLRVEGQAHSLAAGKSLTLAVGRRFVWQLEGRDPQTETIATGEVGMEIVIRR
jgi:hypothetical protein